MIYLINMGKAGEKMKGRESIPGLSIGMIGFLSRVLWIEEFDMFFYVFIFILYIFSLVIIWKYEKGNPGGVIFFILLTITLCFSLYSKNKKDTYVNIVKQKEKTGEIYLYEIDFGDDFEFKYYRIYKRTAFLPFFITKSKGNFSFFGEYEKIAIENNQIKITGKENQEKKKTVLLDLKTGRIISEEK